MITSKQYESALKIVDQYKKENKKKVGRPFGRFYNNEEIKEIVNDFYESGYTESVYYISVKFNLGMNKSKEMLKRLVTERILIKNQNNKYILSGQNQNIKNYDTTTSDWNIIKSPATDPKQLTF